MKMIERLDIRSILTVDERKGIAKLIDDHDEIDYPLAFSYDQWKKWDEQVYAEDLSTLYFMLRATPNHNEYFPTSRAVVMSKIVEALDKEYNIEVAMSFGQIKRSKEKVR